MPRAMVIHSHQVIVYSVCMCADMCVLVYTGTASSVMSREQTFPHVNLQHCVQMRSSGKVRGTAGHVMSKGLSLLNNFMPNF